MNELKLFKQIIDASHYGKCIIDNKKNILVANSFFEETFGKTLGLNLKDFNFIFAEPSVIKLINDAIKFKTNAMIVVTLNNEKNKNQVFRVGIGGPLADMDYYQIEIIDISVLAINQQHIDILFEHSHLYIAVINQKLQIVMANKKFKDLFGNVGTRTLPDLYKRKNSVAQHLFTEDCLKDGKIHSGTQIVYPADDKKVYLFTTVIPLVVKEGKVSMVIGISQDITEINNMQDQMIVQTEYFHSIFQKCAQGLIIISASGRITAMNKAAKEIIFWSKSRKPGILELTNLLEININDDENKEYDKIINIINNEIKHLVIIHVTVLEPSNDKLLLLNRLEPDRYKIQDRLNWLPEDVENYYHMINKTIAEKRRLKPNIVNSFRKKLEDSGKPELIADWNKNFSRLVFTDCILDQLSSFIEGSTKKRTTIKTSTILAKLEEEVKDILNHYSIDIKFKTEYHEKITTNSDILHTALLILIYACSADLSTMEIIKGSIKMKFSIEKYKLPYILVEDNYIDTNNESETKDVCYTALEKVSFLLKMCKCSFNYVFEPNIGRKFWINFEKNETK